MILGIGTDIFEVDRMKRAMEKDSLFIKGIFTEREIQYCKAKKWREQNFAARYAAKEALLKAFGTGWRDGVQYTDIEITNNKLGKPEINLTGKAKEVADNIGIKTIHVSMSHVKDIANAIVIVQNDS